MYGSIEAGGTKFVCAVGDNDFNIIERISFPTTSPKETMDLVFKFFEKYQNELKAIGIASFGPIDVNEKSSTYGYITETPKLLWRNFDFLGVMRNRFNIPMSWTTDVNAAAVGENIVGAGKDVDSVLYYTVGTGFGGGAIQDGKLVQGYSHPEMGHALVRRHKNDDFKGSCPYHEDCIEGMASGVAIYERTGRTAQEIDSSDSFWEIEAYYIAQAVYNAVLYVSPEKVILGGGVMKKEGLLDLVKVSLDKLVSNYIELPNLDEYIVAPELKDNSATLGNFYLVKSINR